MIKFLKSRSNFFKDSLTLIGGMSLAQSIPFLISPLLTRLYTPEEFGAYAIYIALTGILSVVATGKYEPAILLPKSQRSADHVTVLAILITLSVSIASFLLILLLNRQIVTVLNVPEISSYLYLVPLGLLFSGLIQVYTYHLNRNRKYATIGAAKLTQTSTMAGSQLGLGYFGMTTSGLILGTVAGSMIGWFHLKFKSGLAYINRSNYSLSLIRQLARRYQNFPKLYAPHSFINSISLKFPVLFLSSFFGSSIAGFFSLSMQVSLSPIKIIAVAIGQVFSKTISEIYNEGGDLYSFTRQTVIRLAGISIIPFMILIFISPALFEFVFGAEWRVAGEFTQVLLPAYFLSFLVTPIVFLSALLGKQKKAFIIEIAHLILRLAAIITGVVLNSAYIALALYSLVGFFLHLYLLSWLLNIAKEHS